MDKPKISVQIPVYNAGPYLETTLHSILDDPADNYEVLVADDLSTDDSLSILRKWAADDGRVRILPTTRKLGGAGRRRELAEATDAEYIVPFDADDIFLPGRLERQRDQLTAHPEAVAVYGRSLCWNMAAGTLQYYTGRPFSNFLFFSGNPLGHGSVMLRRRALLDVGNYREIEFNGTQVGVAFDYFLWQRLSDAGIMRFDPDFTYIYRLHGNQMVTNHADRYEGAHRNMAEIFRAEHAQLLDGLLQRRPVNVSPQLRPATMKALGWLTQQLTSHHLSTLPFIQAAQQLDPSDHGPWIAECEYWQRQQQWDSARAAAERLIQRFEQLPLVALGGWKLKRAVAGETGAALEIEECRRQIRRLEPLAVGPPMKIQTLKAHLGGDPSR